MNKIYYISQGKTPEEHLQNIEKVCVAGCQWVQLRLKNYSEDVILDTAIMAKRICGNYGVTFIINDHIKVAHKVEAHGVHLGKNDNGIKDARQVLGNKIIGGTANTAADCEMLIKQGIDYIGLGPFRYTETKKHLSAILGIEGCSKILNTNFIKKSSHISIFAIGGILEDDFEALFKTGISGIAVSGLLSKKPIEELKRIIKKSYRV